MARVGETLPEGLADGAAKGPSNAARSARATGWAGTRIATVGNSAVTSADTGSSLTSCCAISRGFFFSARANCKRMRQPPEKLLTD